MWLEPPADLFKEHTVIIAGQGPSLDIQQLYDLSNLFPCIALKDTYIHAPNAEIIYACDRQWWHDRWKTDQALREHKGLRLTLDYQKLDTKVPALHFLKCGGLEGLDDRPGYVRHGNNTGHQAINFVIGAGARKILLLGYTMMALKGRKHFHNRHPPVPNNIFDQYKANLERIAPVTKSMGIDIRIIGESALKCFPRIEYEDAIEWAKEGYRRNDNG